MQLFLSKEERTHIELIMTKRNNLTLQDQLLQKELDAAVIEFSKRNNIDFKRAKTINIEKGFIEYEDEKKDEKKIKKSDKVTK